MKRLVLLILLVSHFSTVYNQIIKGTILDKSSNEKIVGASVYFSGTTVGTLSDQDGNFHLDVSKNTSMPLSISALGYNSATINSFLTTDSLFIYLTPKIFNLNEVIISDKSLARERKSNIKLFKNVFLGTTSNASRCKIINENDISFNYKSDKDTLRAYTLKPLQIENRALGYKITYFLDEFEYDRKNNTFFFKGNLIFNEEITGKEKRKQYYEQQRINSYKGSKMHFFRELWANNLKAAGFTVLDPAGNELDYKKLVFEQNDNKKYLSFIGSLSIIYSPENRVHKNYVYYRGNMSVTYNPEIVLSKIVFLKNRVFFDSTGYNDGTGIKWEGQMVNQRIGDILPYEYGLKDKYLAHVSSGKPAESGTEINQEPVDSGNFNQYIEKIYLHTDRTYYFPGDDIWFKAYLIDAFDRSFSNLSRNLHIELISPSNEIILSRIISLDVGLGNGDFKLPGNLNPGKYRLRAYTNYMRNFSDQIFFNKEINIIGSSAAIEKLFEVEKAAKNNIYLSFFPEGGSLVDNISSIVALKAVDAQGKGCDVSGEVYSSAGDKITSFRSTHLGMGTFILTPSFGLLNYYTIIKGPDNTEIRSELPKSFATGVTLSASFNDTKELSISVKTNELTLPLVKGHDLLLIISVRNKTIKTIIFRMDSLSHSLILPTEDLPAGIIMLTLKTLMDLPLAERIIFIEHGQNLNINIQTDKSIYKRRDPVSMRVSIAGDSINQEAAFLSFSAAEGDLTDNLKEFPTTIASWFLLESDVQGTVEGPSYYFDSANPDRFRDLNLLLLTQGWRDFSWKSDSTNYYAPETGFFVSGRLRKINKDKPIVDSKIHITILQADKIISETVPTDSLGRFYLGNIDMTGNARLIASAVNRNDRPEGLLLLDSVNYKPAKVSKYLPASGVGENGGVSTLIKDNEFKEKETKLEQEYKIKESIKKKYKMSDTISLGEVTITARKPRDLQVAKIESIRSVYGGKPDAEVVVTPKTNYLDAPKLLMGTPGVFVMKDSIGYTIRISREIVFGSFTKSGAFGKSNLNPLLLVDGIKRPIETLNILPASIIDRIDVLKSISKTAVYGIDGANGVISVITRSGTNNNIAEESESAKHTVKTTLSGYDSPRIFYSPHHDPSTSSDGPDLRTTLYWKPDIILQTGKELILNYFNADNSSTIRIIIEGITSTGIPVTTSAEYQVKD